EQGAESLVVGLVEAVVGVQPEDPLAPGMPQALVAGGGEAVHPWEVEHAGAKLSGDLAGAVGGAGVHHDDFVHQAGSGTQAGPQVVLLILGDHTERDAGPLPLTPN